MNKEQVKIIKKQIYNTFKSPKDIKTSFINKLSILFISCLPRCCSIFFAELGKSFSFYTPKDAEKFGIVTFISASARGHF